MSDIIVEKSSVELPENLIFGKILTPHVFEMDYSGKDGQWINPAIKELKNLELSPAAMVFHYGQAIFEGLKAYKRVDGKIGLFRPEKNFERLNRSARRMCIPEFDEEMVLNALKELIKLDQDWIPTKPGYSLYIRPLVFGMDPLLGVKPSQDYKFIIMLSPVGPYYPEGFKPVPILATDKYVRAVRDGVGDCKTAGNYAASLYAQVEAKKQGFTQVLFLDAIEKKYVEEVGTMNFFVHFKDEVATAKLNGSILPGITRLSVLQILKEWNYNVSERNISIDEIFEAHENGNLVELFGTGTAAVISSISKLKYRDNEILFDQEEPGELGMRLYKELSDIQYGVKEDTRNWITYVE
ncbi:MAG: branched-chain amino acid aminotransferase [Chlorobi bacterium]|nr:branched-chain amino acid aminotransferase [Chlorobiota bacterium]